MAQSISINGKTYDVDLDEDTPMLWVLRDACAIVGTRAIFPARTMMPGKLRAFLDFMREVNRY
jgi:hypothetical protein